MESRPIELYKKLEYAITYMEDHIQAGLNLDELARNVFISKFYLHRIFKALTGDNIMSYFRKRKMSASAECLLRTNLRIADIACEYGFEHYQSYIRAFRNQFGMTPQQFRGGKAPIVFSEKLDIGRFLPIEGGMLQKPEIKLLSKLHLVGKRNKISLRENYANQTANQAGLLFFHKLKKGIRHQVNPNIYYGLTLFDEGYPDYTYYIPSTRTAGTDKLPDGMETITIPASKYYCFKYIGMHHPEALSSLTLASIWKEIFGNWMPSIGYSPTLQIEIMDYSLASADYCEMDLLYPIKE